MGATALLLTVEGALKRAIGSDACLELVYLVPSDTVYLASSLGRSRCMLSAPFWK